MKASFLVLLMFMNTPAFSSQITGVFLNSDTELRVSVLDDPGAAPFEAAVIFDFLNVPLTRPTPYKPQQRELLGKMFSISCGVPGTAQPSGERFGSCKMILKTGPFSQISEAAGTGVYEVTGEDAAILFRQLRTDGNEVFSWASRDRKVEIESTVGRFAVRYSNR